MGCPKHDLRFGPSFVRTVCGPEEGGFHAFGHGFCVVLSAAMFLQSRPLAVASGAVQEISSPVIGWRKFFVIRHPGVEGAIGV